MIKYKLACNNCKITFDSWFASSKEYERLKKKNFLVCHHCNSQKVEKTLMAPQLIKTKKLSDASKDIAKFNSIKKKMKNYQKFVKENFKHVGENFAYEARSIHYDKQKKTKGIYGSASQNDLKELKEEGIDVQIVPWLDDTGN